MTETRTRSAARWYYFVGANACVFLLVCASAIKTGAFELRVMAESFAASFLILLTVFGWFSSAPIGKRLLGALMGIAATVIACRFVLMDGFASWFESAIWFLPVTSIVCGAMYLKGLRIRVGDTSRRQSYSIRGLMIVTAIVAVLFPTISLVQAARNSGNWQTMLWLSDSLVLVTPLVLIAIGMAWSVLSNQLFYAGVLLLTSPIFGVLICRIYGWNDYNLRSPIKMTRSRLNAILG